MLGALGGLIVCSNPVGWVVGACVAGGAAIGAGTVGSITGALEI